MKIPHVLALAIGASVLLGCDAPERPPNVLLYVVDTLRADATTPYGNRVVATPALERLAREGTVYRNAYAASSWTRASVVSLLTGLDPDAHGVENRPSPVPDSLVMLSEQFRQHGYATASIVTNPNVASFFGFDEGYDEFFELYARRQVGKVSSLAQAPSDEVGRRAIEWIDSADRPFFLFVLSTDPHWPYEPPPRFDRYGGDYAGDTDGRQGARSPGLSDADRERVRSLYLGEVAFTDDSLGHLLDDLDDRDLARSTIVAVTSDHGEEFWEHGRRGHGMELFEESLRVPLLLRYPPRVPAGVEVEALVRGVDVAPTLLALAGLPVPEGLDGLPLPEDGAIEASREVYASLLLDRARRKALIEHPWKIVWDPRRGTASLFHLDRDPGETRDLAGAEPERAAAMQRRLVERAARNNQRRESFWPSPASRRVPAHLRDALEALGYVDPEEE